MSKVMRLFVSTGLLSLIVLTSSSFADLDFAVKLKTGDLHPVPMKSVPSTATALQGRHILIQFDKPLTASEQDRLRGEGIELLDYIPNFVYTARLDRTPDQSTMDEFGIRWFDAIKPSQKISPYITDLGIPDWARHGDDSAQFVVVFHPDQALNQAGQMLESDFGGQIIGLDPILNSADVILQDDAIYAIAERDDVLWIEQALPPPRETNNSNRANTGADVVQTAPYNLSGTGVTVAEWDGGRADPDQYDFGGRVISLDFSSIETHSTHVAGTVMGSGETYSDRRYRGMAPAAILLTQQWWNSSSEMTTEYGEAITSYDADISTNSWGYGAGDPVSQSSCESTMGNYWSVCTTVDNIVRGAAGAPITIVWSAGNQRGFDPSYCGWLGWTYNTVTPLPTSKNVIAVGAVNSNNSTMTSFSSWGPTDDGRIKPDVTGPGCQSNGDYGVTSTRPGSGYTTMCGTSMSAPTVAGVLALMKEEWDTKIGTGQLLPSTMKAILINTATDLGPTGPDYQFGHGNVDAVKAATKIGIGEPSYIVNQISTGDVHSYDLTVPGGAEKLKVTIVWDDPGGTVSASQHLKNDIDLVLIDPFDAEQYPWVLDPLNPAQPATRNVDHVNNVETVEIPNPTPGLWKARVSGYNIPVGPQSYSLVFTPDSINTPGNQRAIAVFDSGDITENPGLTVPITFWVTNTGAALDSLHIQIVDSVGWMITGRDTTVSLSPYDSVELAVSATIPSPALAGDQDVISCSAVSLTDGSVTALNRVAIVAAAYYEPVITQSIPLDTVSSPDTYGFSVTVENLGNATDTILVTPIGDVAWTFGPPFTDVILGPGQSSPVNFDAYVPAEVSHETVSEVTVVADGSNATSDTTSFQLFVSNPNFPPELLSPGLNAYTQDGTPTFTWSSDGDSYALYVATDSQLTNVIHTYTGIPSTSFTVPSEDTLSDGHYFWAVRMFVGADSSSLQRYPHKLSVDNIAPQAIVPSSPRDKTYIKNPLVGFLLEYGTGLPPQTNAPEYNILQISHDSLFETGVETHELTGFTYQPTAGLEPGRWYWRGIRADSAGNMSTPSAPFTFLIDTAAPSIPTLLSPPDGGSVDGDTIIFTWSTDSLPAYEVAPVYYYLHVSHSPDFGDYSIFANFVHDDTVKLPTANLQEFETYYWRVKAYDSAGYYSAYSAAADFIFASGVCGDMDGDFEVNLSDITTLIGYVYLGGNPPVNLALASVDCIPGTDLSDITRLIDHVYISHDPLCCSAAK